MSRGSGSKNFSGSFEVLAGAPLDARTVVNTKSDLYAEGSYPYAYVGMIVSVKEEGKAYILKALPTSTQSNWAEVGGGSGVPSGGTTNQVLTKNSSADGDVIWKTPADTSKFFSTDDSAFTAIDDNDFIPVHDTSASAKMRSSWGNMKSLLKTYFDTVYQEPITAGSNLSFSGSTLNASYPLMVNEFDKANLYSTTEKVVGCWTDGRPLYQKTVELGAGPAANAKKTYALNVSNILSYVYCNVWSTWGNATYGDIPNLNAHCWIDDTGNLTIQSMNSANLTTTYNFCVLRYTKTTDAANSFNYASENDYSTTEKIIGTWIDGKPLYQKTVSYGALPNNTYTRVSTGLPSSTCKIREIKGYAFQTTNSVTSPIVFSSPTGISSDVNILTVADGGYMKIQIQTGTDRSTFTECYVTIKYTKTTD